MLPGNFGFQGDATLEHRWSTLEGGSSPSIDDPTTQTVLAAHAFWRDSSRGSLGIIGQYVQEKTDYSIDSYSISSDGSHKLIGGEGQIFLQNLTLYAQAAYHDSSFSEYVFNIDGHGFSLAGQARYFIQPNWLVALKAGYDSLDLSVSYGPTSAPDITQKVWSLGARTEFQLTDLPISLFSEVTYSDGKLRSDDSFEMKVKDTRVMVGVKYRFGGKSLFDQDRSGASFDPLDVRNVMVLFGGPV